MLHGSIIKSDSLTGISDPADAATVCEQKKKEPIRIGSHVLTAKTFMLND